MGLDINIVVFDGFEPLDVFGPFEVFINTDGARVRLFSLEGPGVKVEEDGVRVEAVGPEAIDPKGVLLIPGGSGTRTLVGNDRWIGQLANLAAQSSQVMTVCTGSALLAVAGVLDGRRATSNDLAFDWVVSTGKRVNWVKDARWVVDGKFRTSSGISAGIDMALAFVEDTCGPEAADRASTQMEYIRNRDSGYDPFA
ncbi:DJ-1/PfpI family protein [Bifidobacterium sp. B4081]|uniref:DJ-1/PfpI family protein n=1 Tax=unclassified Bifidobacterium TaxID=2608897 RepID=UPI00226A1DE9|nr:MULTISPECIES: DJ-1/PfpI family protein [unclassified Bifidobacterium]MCX8643459.1 DJ-1/PfpI family protein [Bifidobacterium sp. B4077]MCX8645641.1 DJ-1/PfpI family protein [Bifidobacterium sp. B4081]MCX8668649.1 DJ-1/PfpI family protein [Bifidobacterium sp. B3998]